MRRIALALLLYFASPLLAQAPPGFVTVTGTRILDGSTPNGAPAPLAAGKFRAQFMAKGQAFNASLGGGGQATTSVFTANIVAGAFTLFLPDTALTNPLNACLAVTISDAAGNVLARYPCVQPTSAGGSPWCTTTAGQTACNFDHYTQALPALAMSTPGPKGDPGPAGTGAPGLDPTPAATGGLPNGIPNLLAGPCLAVTCLISVPPTYSVADVNPFDALLNYTAIPNPAARLRTGSAVRDTRGGTDWHGVTNPAILGGAYGTYAARRTSLLENRSTAQLLALGGLGLVVGHEINALFIGGGNDDGASTHGKSTFLAQPIDLNSNSAGQIGGGGYQMNCFGDGGDCNTNENYVFSAAGSGMGGGEGTHGQWEKINGVQVVPVGTCSAGCTTGSTSIKFSGPLYKQLGQNRLLIDISKAQALTLVNGTLPTAPLPFPGATFQGSTLGTSIFLESSIGFLDTPTSTSPGPVTVPIKAAPDFTGFAGSTAALPASGIACVADSDMSNGVHFETAPFTVVDATHLALLLYHIHRANFAIAVGGACGLGFEQTATTANGLRQIFPALGSLDPTHALLASQSNIFGIPGASAFAHLVCSPNTVSRTANVATATFPAYFCDSGGPVSSLHGLPVTVSGMADSTLNGTATASLAPSGYQITYPSTGPDVAPTAVSGPSVTYWTSGAKAYPVAETQSILSSASDVDGTLTLGANLIPFAPGDTIEQPVGSYPTFNGAAETLHAVIPVLTGGNGHTIQLTGTEAFHPGTVGYGVVNSQPTTAYQGGGGTNPPPHTQFQGSGVYNWGADLQGGKQGDLTFLESPFCTPTSTFLCTTHFVLHGASSIDRTHDPLGIVRDLYNFNNADLAVAGKLVCTFDGTTSANCPPAGTGPAGPAGPQGATGPAGASASSIANIQIALPTATIAANSCTSASIVAMAGVQPTSTFTPTFATDSSGVTGWGATGGLDPVLWPTQDHLNYRICNVTAAAITPGAITLNVGAK